MHDEHPGTPSRRMSSLQARPDLVVVLAVALAFGGGLWLQILHGVEGLTARQASPLWVSWLRDASLTLPLAVLAVWAALLLTSRFLSRSRQDMSVTSVAITLAALAALLTSVLLAVVYPALGQMFGETARGKQPLLLAMLHDGALLATATFALALGATWLLRARLVEASRPSAAVAGAAPRRTAELKQMVLGKTKQQHRMRAIIGGALALL